MLFLLKILMLLLTSATGLNIEPAQSSVQKRFVLSDVNRLCVRDRKKCYLRVLGTWRKKLEERRVHKVVPLAMNKIKINKRRIYRRTRYSYQWWLLLATYLWHIWLTVDAKAAEEVTLEQSWTLESWINSYAVSIFLYQKKCICCIRASFIAYVSK